VIAWLVWFFAALPLSVADHWLRSCSMWTPDLTLALASFCALHARPRALPGILLAAALARSAIGPGSAALQLLVLGVPIAALLPLRILFYRRELLVQILAAAFLAVAVPHLTGFLARLVPDSGLAPELVRRDLLAAIVMVPPAAFVLGAVPPLRWFAERAE
jgi:hypothetical protein